MLQKVSKCWPIAARWTLTGSAPMTAWQSPHARRGMPIAGRRGAWTTPSCRLRRPWLPIDGVAPTQPPRLAQRLERGKRKSWPKSSQHVTRTRTERCQPCRYFMRAEGTGRAGKRGQGSRYQGGRGSDLHRPGEALAQRPQVRLQLFALAVQRVMLWLRKLAAVDVPVGKE